MLKTLNPTSLMWRCVGGPPSRDFRPYEIASTPPEDDIAPPATPDEVKFLLRYSAPHGSGSPKARRQEQRIPDAIGPAPKTEAIHFRRLQAGQVTAEGILASAVRAGPGGGDGGELGTDYETAAEDNPSPGTPGQRLGKSRPEV